MKGFRSPVSPHPPEKSVERPDEPLPQADGDPGPPTYASLQPSALPHGQGRCTICNEPFIYGWGNPLTESFKKNEDRAIQSDEGDWIHTSCKKGI